MFSRRTCFLLLWVLVAAGWAAMLGTTLSEVHGAPFGLAVLLPERFVAWSLLALPLAVATLLFVRDRAWRARGLVAAGAALWLALLAASFVLAQYAPDVGGTPRQDPALAWPLGVLTFAVPFVLSGWFIRRLGSRP